MKIKQKLVSLVNNNKIFLLILVIGIFLRLWKPLELFMYSHDQDLLSWFVKDIVNNHNLRLIGQETSVHGVFIGPLWYYLAIPFYLAFGMDPKGGLLLSAIVAIFTIVSVYYVFSEIKNKKIGILGALLYSVSFYSVLTDREVVPTTPTILWSVWAFYVVHLMLTKKYKLAFLLSGVLIGLAWHISMGLILVIPLFALSFLFSLKGESLISFKKKFGNKELKGLIIGALFMFMFLSPFILFDLRHGFEQTKSILHSSSSEAPVSFLKKLDRTTTLANKNIIGFTWGPYINLPNRYPLYLLSIIFIFLVFKKKISKALSTFIFLWVSLFILFFSFNSLNLSEYYLNGVLVVEVFVLAAFLDFLFAHKASHFIAEILLVLFIAANVVRLFTIPINKSGYVERKAIVQFIKQDASDHNYPCVSVSYITDPGDELGYRYLYYIEKMHVNEPSSNAPVYTIVFPHSKVNRLDKSFGALGLIYPDYSHYSEEGIAKSCSGENANETDPLFGYVQ